MSQRVLSAGASAAATPPRTSVRAQVANVTFCLIRVAKEGVPPLLTEHTTIFPSPERRLLCMIAWFQTEIECAADARNQPIVNCFVGEVKRIASPAQAHARPGEL